jgi:hypothetical protein
MFPRNAGADLFVTQGSGVSEYDTFSGAPININFITGLTFPSAVVVENAK